MVKPASLALSIFIACFSFPPDARCQTLRDAARLDAEGKCVEAEKTYQTLLQKGAPSPALLNNAGNHYLACGQPAKAQVYFETLLRINPLHANANLQLARIANEHKQGKKALEYLNKVKDSDPSVQLLRAEALHWAGNSSAAEKILDALEKEYSSDPRGLFLLGLTSGRLALYVRAETAFSNALVLKPGDFEILLNLGRAAARAGHYDRAQRALDSALKIQPDNVDLLLELGRISAARQDYVRAVYVLAQARQKAPGNAGILLLLARAAEDAGYYDDAAKTYDEYLRLKPEDDAGRRDRARVCGFTENRKEEARQELDWYLGKHPKDPLGHYAFAQVFWYTEPQESLTHLTEAARLDPDSLAVRFSRAWMLQRLGQMAESLPDLEAAHRMDPGNFRVLDLMGLAHLALEKPAEAEKDLRQAIAIAPNDPEVVLHLGRAVMAQGREDEAQALLDQYRKIRPQRLPGRRKHAGIIELATLSAPELRAHEIVRLSRDAREHPDRPDYQLHLASLLLANGQKEESLREFEVLLGRNASSQVWEEAGALLLQAHQPKMAREFLQRAAAERPAAQLDLAIVLFELEGPEPALQYLEKILEERVTGDGLLLKANLLEAAGRLDEAGKTLSQGLGQAASKPEIVRPASLSLMRLGRKAEALNLLERALQPHSQDLDLLLTRAALLGVMEQMTASGKALREIELHWPEENRAYLAHGLLLEKQARREDARQKLQIAKTLGSQDPALNCALERLAGQSPAGPECACHSGLEQWLFSTCGR
jgi:tetratricopeptide (TPR) repeat protein